MTKLARCLVLLLSCVFSAVAPAEQTRLTAARPVVWRDFLGVNAHFLWFTPAQYQGQIQQLKALGLEWVRVTCIGTATNPRKTSSCSRRWINWWTR